MPYRPDDLGCLDDPSRLDDPGTNKLATPPATRVNAALSPLMRSVMTALQVPFAPEKKAEFIDQLRQAQRKIDDFIARSGSNLSPSCARLLLRLGTALEVRLIGVSTRAQRKLVQDHLAEHGAGPRPPKVPFP